MPYPTKAFRYLKTSSGKRYQGKRPAKPGFMIIGTQNPVTMAGRRAPSTALSRRLITMELAPYSIDEMILILKSKSLHSSQAIALANAYQKQATFAAINHLKPPPSFRDVIKIADGLCVNYLTFHVMSVIDRDPGIISALLNSLGIFRPTGNEVKAPSSLGTTMGIHP